MATISPLTLVRNNDVTLKPPPPAEAGRNAREAAEAVIRCVEQCAQRDRVAFRDVEDEVRDLVFAFARAALVLFLALRDEAVMATYPAGERFESWGRSFRRAPAIARNLTTVFGVLQYWRTYMREVAEKERSGFYPLDVSLGLSAERFSWNVLAKATWLATKLPFAEARSTLAAFMPNAPSTEVIEQAVLGFGRFTAMWFVDRPPPLNDGEVLIIMFDGKGIPTATEEELRRRRRKRSLQKAARSQRHRGRAKRRRHPKKPRRSIGDKSKNAKSATIALMYSLRREGTRRLVGPINKWVYGSFAPKEHAFQVARVEADKRGFTEGSGKLVQIVTDGDPDLALYGERYFPSAEHTIDVWHVVEYLWDAGRSLYKEGTRELRRWVKEQQDRLFEDRTTEILAELERRLATIAATGPGNKARRDRLTDAIRYIGSRKDKLRYGSLRRRDLEISSGPVEGAIKHIIAKRQDHGGMRWIPERAEAILQLRCIEVVGDWGRFERYVHDRMHLSAVIGTKPVRLQQSEAEALPEVRAAA